MAQEAMINLEYFDYNDDVLKLFRLRNKKTGEPLQGSLWLQRGNQFSSRNRGHPDNCRESFG